MNVRRLTSIFLAIFVILGLAAAPLGGPAFAGAGRSAGATEVSMPADMPCCPDEQKKDCQDCPLVALCVLKSTQAGPPATASLPLRHPVKTTHVFRDDLFVTGSDRPPPDHPPRILV